VTGQAIETNKIYFHPGCHMFEKIVWKERILVISRFSVGSFARSQDSTDRFGRATAHVL